jgi:hypothetical protein
MTAIELVRRDKTEFLKFFRSKFPLFHLSNVFYLDVKYALKYYLLTKHLKVSEAELEPVAKALINEMVSDGVFRQVSSDTWTLNYAEFRTKTPGKPILR